MPTLQIISKRFISGSYRKADIPNIVSQLSPKTELAASLLTILTDLVTSPYDAVSLLVALKDPRNKGKLFLCVITENNHTSSAFLISQVNNDAPKAHVSILLSSQVKIDLLGDGILCLQNKNTKVPIYCQVYSLLTLWSTVETLRMLRDSQAKESSVRLNVEIEALSGVGIEEEDEKKTEEDHGIGGRSFRVLTTDESDVLWTLEALIPPANSFVLEKEEIYRKPDPQTLKDCISNFVKESKAPDDITIADVLSHVKAIYGDEIVGKYGYSKAFIDGVVYRVYGELEAPSLILPGLWLGSEYNAADMKALEKIGVSHILNVAIEVDRFFPDDFVYMKIHVVDDLQADLLTFFERACEFIDLALHKGSGIFVHCQRGVSRSAACVIAYIMLKERISLQDAMKFVKEKRRIIRPNTAFLTQLECWEEELKKRSY